MFCVLPRHNSEINLEKKIGCISIKFYKFCILAYEQTPAKTYQEIVFSPV